MQCLALDVVPELLHGCLSSSNGALVWLEIHQTVSNAFLIAALQFSKEVEAEGQTGAGAGTASGFTAVAMTDLFAEMQKPPPLPDFVSHATVSALRQFVEGTLGKQLSGEWEGRTVQEVVHKLLCYQGVKAWDITVTHAQVLYM